jgi:hypothetical protein
VDQARQAAHRAFRDARSSADCKSLEVIAAVISHESGGIDVRVLVNHYLGDGFADRKTQRTQGMGRAPARDPRRCGWRRPLTLPFRRLSCAYRGACVRPRLIFASFWAKLRPRGSGFIPPKGNSSRKP